MSTTSKVDRGAVSEHLNSDYEAVKWPSEIYLPKQMCTITEYLLSVQDRNFKVQDEWGNIIVEMISQSTSTGALWNDSYCMFTFMSSYNVLCIPWVNPGTVTLQGYLFTVILLAKPVRYVDLGIAVLSALWGVGGGNIFVHSA